MTCHVQSLLFAHLRKKNDYSGNWCCFCLFAQIEDLPWGPQLACAWPAIYGNQWNQRKAALDFHQLQHHDYWHIIIIIIIIIITIIIVLDTWLSPRSSMRALILPLVSLPRVRVPGSLIRLGGDYQLINDDDNHCHNSYHWVRLIITGVFDISKRAGSFIRLSD